MENMVIITLEEYDELKKAADEGDQRYEELVKENSDLREGRKIVVTQKSDNIFIIPKEYKLDVEAFKTLLEEAKIANEDAIKNLYEKISKLEKENSKLRHRNLFKRILNII